ncbi:MAG: hypothetical protein AAGJ83_14405, partial [Planctomycetota bacterium]
GSEFAGEWLAAMQTVEVPTEELYDSATPENQEAGNRADLLVLVQYRLQSVFAPVAEMKQTLFLEGIWAVTSFLLVSLTLWFLVRMIGKDPKTVLTPAARLSRDSTLPPGSTPSAVASRPESTGMTETIVAPGSTSADAASEERAASKR